MNKKQKIILGICIVIFIISFTSYFLSIRLIYPRKYSEQIEKYSNEYEINSEIIYTMIKAESNFDKNVVSTAGAKGLMQLMPSTAEEVAKRNDIEFSEEMLFDADFNIKLGVIYYKSLYKKYNNTGLTLAAYNAGTGTVDKWIEEKIINEEGTDLENIPFEETNSYVRKILRDVEVYKKLYK